MNFRKSFEGIKDKHEAEERNRDFVETGAWQPSSNGKFQVPRQREIRPEFRLVCVVTNQNKPLCCWKLFADINGRISDVAFEERAWIFRLT